MIIYIFYRSGNICFKNVLLNNDFGTNAAVWVPTFYIKIKYLWTYSYVLKYLRLYNLILSINT